MKPSNVKRFCAAMPLALVLLLTGCATNSPISANHCPILPAMPAVSEPMPSQTFSFSVQETIESWRKRLIELQATDKH